MRKALVVGIDDYPNNPLNGCVNDAKAVAQVIETHSDGEPNFEVKLLVSPDENNPSADGITRKQLRSELDALFAGDPEVALFYFAGHGIVKNVGGYIVTSDLTKYDEGVPMDDVLKLANQSKAKDKVILLDSCRSGKFGTSEIAGGNVSYSLPRPDRPDGESRLGERKRKEWKRCLYVLVSRCTQGRCGRSSRSHHAGKRLCLC